MDLEKLLEDSGAVLKGHFLLASGRHSDVYFEKFRLIEQPPVLTALCTEIAEHFQHAGVEAVAGPTTGGIIIAFEVAKQMGLPAVYIENEDGKKALRRNKTLPAGQKVLIVDDVLTTGGSLFDSRDAIVRAGGEVVGFGVLIDRRQPDFKIDAPLFGAYRVDAVSYAPEEVPDWLAAIPLKKPGTSKV